jgi:hypothetical protein
MQNINLVVKEVSTNNGKWDSLYEDKNITYVPNTGATIGNPRLDIKNLKNWVKYANRRDSVRFQIRIPLSAALPIVFLQRAMILL